MKKLFMLSIAALLAATGIGCSDDQTDGPGRTGGGNENAVPVYVKGTNGDFRPVICIADIEHTWYECVVKNGVSLDGGKSFPTCTIGGVWTNALDWDRNPVDGNVNISFDNYGGDVVGTQADASSPIYFSVLPEGTLIDDNLAWVENSTYTEANDRAPYIWSSQSPETNKGQSGYVVGKFWYQNAEGGSGGYYRGWIKVTVSEGSVKVGGMCLCLGGGDFRTGDMPVPGANPDPEPEDPKPLEFRLLAPVVEDGFDFPAVTANNNATWFGFKLPGDGGVWGVSGLWGHQTGWTDASDTGSTYISIENNGGDVVGTQPAGASTPIYYSIVPENTPIDDNLTWVTNPGYNQTSGWQYVPRVWDSENPSINKGQSGYIVGKFHYRHDAEKIPDGYYRGWVKIDVSDDGAVTASGMCICIGEGEFKTGQLPENPYPKPEPVGDYLMVNLEGAEGFQTTMSYSSEDQFLKGLLGNTYIGVGLAAGVATWGQTIMTQSWGGSIVGTRSSANDPIFYSVFDADTEIVDEMSWIAPGTNSYDELATISAADYADNKGKSGYLVGTFPYQNLSADIQYAFHRGWIEVEIAATGAVTFKRMCVCINDKLIFRTGQTEGTEIKPDDPKPQGDYLLLPVVNDGPNFPPVTVNDNGTWVGFNLPWEGGSTWGVAGLWGHAVSWADGSNTSNTYISIENNGGDVVGIRTDASAPIYFSILPEDTLIDNELAWVTNPGYVQNGDNWQHVPRIWDSENPSINKGQSGYVVGRFHYRYESKNIPDGYYRGWVKIEVSEDGAVTASGMCLCVDDSKAFKTGQTE